MTHIHHLLLPIKIRIEVVPKRTTRIIETKLLINTINLLHILRRELKVAFQIRLYTRRGLGFRENGVAFCHAPCESDLCARFVVFLADFDEGGVILHIISISFITEFREQGRNEPSVCPYSSHYRKSHSGFQTVSIAEHEFPYSSAIL